jgi:hypothetical protein
LRGEVLISAGRKGERQQLCQAMAIAKAQCAKSEIDRTVASLKTFVRKRQYWPFGDRSALAAVRSLLGI